MPMGDIREKFTSSELALLGWRSQEQSYKMKEKFKSTSSNPRAEKESRGAEKLLNEEGNIDLRKATFKEAVNYLNNIGMKFPVPLERTPAVTRG